MADLTRFDSERTTTATTNGGPSDEFPEKQTIAAVTLASDVAEPEYPDGGLRAWLVVCGVRIQLL